MAALEVNHHGTASCKCMVCIWGSWLQVSVQICQWRLLEKCPMQASMASDDAAIVHATGAIEMDITNVTHLQNITQLHTIFHSFNDIAY